MGEVFERRSVSARNIGSFFIVATAFATAACTASPSSSSTDRTGSTSERMASSTQCRADDFVAYWSPSSNKWCGSSCTAAGGSASPAMMQRLNQDGTGAQLDHILPSVVALDYGRFGASWLDFRFAPADDYGYRLLDGMLRLDPTSGVLSEYESPPWPSLSGVYNSGFWYGDINAHSNGRDHAHFFDEYTTVGVWTAAVTSVQSPFSQFP